MKKLALFALILAAAFSTPRAEAQFSLIPYIGYNTELEGFLIGIGSEFAAPFAAGSLDLAIRPSIEYHSADAGGFGGGGVDLNYFQINGDVLARFSGSESVAPFAGAGLAVAITSIDVPDGAFGDDDSSSSTDIGINVFGGAEFPGLLSLGMPFAEIRYSIVSAEYFGFDIFGDQLSVFGGIKIPLGQ